MTKDLKTCGHFVCLWYKWMREFYVCQSCGIKMCPACAAEHFEKFHPGGPSGKWTRRCPSVNKNP